MPSLKPLVKTIGAIGRTLNARTVLYPVIQGESMVSETGQTKIKVKVCIVL